MAIEQRPAGKQGTESKTSSLRGVVSRRAEEWVGQLMDFSRRNQLLYFRVLKKGTLDLGDANFEALNRLLDGKSVPLSQLFEGSDEEDLDDRYERVRRIRAKARENFEERSIETLQLAVGMVHWIDPKSDAAERASSGAVTPSAPLLLMPLEIRPIKGGADYSFRAGTDGCVVNPVLVEYLARTFALKIAEPDIEVDGDSATAWERIDSLVPVFEQLPEGKVRKTVIVGNFTYAKLTMVQDINGDLEAMASHLVIQAICGVEAALEQIRGHAVDPPLDAPNRISPANEFLILDADSSQNRIINAIAEGRTFAFDGPPGTGKSQTIANAIAVLVAMGKSVLFVAEKRAAIDVVVKRLGAANLSDLVMDYHGVGNKKKELIQKVGAVIPALRTSDAGSIPYKAPKLERVREELLSYASALHMPDPNSRNSVYDYLVLLAAHQENCDGEFALPRSPQLEFAQVEELDGLIRELARFGGFATGRGPDVWRSVDSFGDDEVEATLDQLEQIQRESLPDVAEYMPDLGDLMGTDEAALTGSTLRLLASTMDLQGRHGTELLACKAKSLLTRLQPAEGPIASVLRPLVSRDIRSARSEIRKICGTRFSCRTAVEVLRETDGIQREVKRQKKPFDPTTDLNSDSRLRGFDVAWQRLEEDCVNLSRLPIVLETLDTGLPDLSSLLDDILSARDVALFLSDARAVETTLREAGLGRLIDAAQKTNPGIDWICSSMWVAWLHKTIGRALPRNTATAEGQSMSLDRTSEQFRVEDRLHLERTPERILTEWRRRFNDAANRYPKQWADLNGAVNKKRNIPTLSKLLRETRDVLLTVKPVWVMSPLSVSMLRPEPQSFDVVIFDEASQIIPADAITSIKAGKQVVVAGDDQQLPPTTFFAGTEIEDDGLETDGEDDDADSIGDYESILQVFKSFITRPMQLQWHYRSRDERLIAYSNDKIYRTLTTFADSLDDSPLRLVRVPFGPDAVGKRGSNEAEVRTVCDLIESHVLEHPDESLGVIALGINHAEAIEAELRRRTGSLFGIDSFHAHHELEPFFVKNLERVQGDERDAIILSIGYGRGTDGRVKYSFGPINGRHGTRRLNVATTRAKSRLTVVSTFGSEDLDEQMCSTGGRVFLRGYLRFVETGGTDFGAAPSDADMNAFERSIFKHLTRAGLDVVPQYGVGRHRIDFAIRDPRDPSRFALALECDGASYHSQPTARERDRLRQEMLEQRGWTFHRIWSTDWFNFPERCIERLLERLENLD